MDGDADRWKTRKKKQQPKDKSHIYSTLTVHALHRAEQRGVRVKDVMEGRANVKPCLTEDGRYATIIPTKKSKKPVRRARPNEETNV